MTEDGPDRSIVKGKRLIALAWQSTAAFIVVLLGGVFLVDRFGVFVVVTSISMFGLGLVLLVLAFALGLRRSRFEHVSVAGLFLLSGSSPSVARRVLTGSILVQLTAAFTAAGVRIYTDVAYAVLGPIFVFGVAAFWAGRYGTFPPRPSDPS